MRSSGTVGVFQADHDIADAAASGLAVTGAVAVFIAITLVSAAPGEFGAYPYGFIGLGSFGHQVWFPLLGCLSSAEVWLRRVSVAVFGALAYGGSCGRRTGIRSLQRVIVRTLAGFPVAYRIGWVCLGCREGCPVGVILVGHGLAGRWRSGGGFVGSGFRRQGRVLVVPFRTGGCRFAVGGTCGAAGFVQTVQRRGDVRHGDALAVRHHDVAG